VTFNAAAYLTDGLQAVNWTACDLWIAVVGLGGHLDLHDVSEIISGEREPYQREYDLLALALNEQFQDLGRDNPINYWSELPVV
jgi:hypothetical protein